MHYRYLLTPTLVLAIALTSGCANLNSVYREFDVDSGKSVMVDIKQRAVIASKHTDGNKSKTVICAEPSPDALSAYAAELAAEGKLPEGTAVQLAAAFQESSSYVGLRTQSIQLLRDALYRLCEGYMSGALEKSQYDILMRRYQKYMVALLGIEQLTGTVRAPAITINTQGTAEAARSISSMRDEIGSIDAKVKSLEQQKTAEGVTDARKAEIDKELASLKGDKEAVTKAIENARGLSSSGSANATVHLYGQTSQRSDEHIQAVTEAVKEIVLTVINTDDFGQLCFSHFGNSNASSALTSICTQYLSNVNKQHEVRLKIEEELVKSGKTDAEKKSLKDAIKRMQDSGLGVKAIGNTE